jgi:hypothetical protein
MSEAGYEDIVKTAGDVTQESNGRFVALPGMEWSTISPGNHVNVLGSRAIAKARSGEYEELYEQFLPQRRAAGDFALLQFNHPGTFADQVFGVQLTVISKLGDRRARFNDYGLDDYPPLSDVRDQWMDGSAKPDPAIVKATLAKIEEVVRPYARIMEVTRAGANEVTGRIPVNPSLVPSKLDPTQLVRTTNVHTDWDYYLLHGFLLAPTANHDNHYANWGTGHTSRTGVVAPTLSEHALLQAIDRRLVFASEDQNLQMRLYAAGRTPMGGFTKTLDTTAALQLSLHDDDFSGTYNVTVYRGKIGNDKVEVDQSLSSLGADTWHDIKVSLPTEGRWFVYVEVHEPEPNRMAWSAPIWIERL